MMRLYYGTLGVWTPADPPPHRIRPNINPERCSRACVILVCMRAAGCMKAPIRAES